MKSIVTWLLRRPGRAAGAAVGALVVVTALAFAAQGLPGRGDGARPGVVTQDGSPGGPGGPGPSLTGPTSTDVDSDQEDSGDEPAASDPENDGHDRDAAPDTDHDQAGQVADTDDAGGDSD
ncbi:MAG TPA: hypothetical protein VFJ09_15760 [Nocardioidaceae bacterium]|nr:hypothetical protein [Nocardioidaceae bacterium]